VRLCCRCCCCNALYSFAIFFINNIFLSFLGAIEKQKFVYVMNRDSANRLTISSPLEAHKNDCILFSVVGIDVGFDNPIFGMIEMEYTEADQDPSGEAAAETEKRLTYYELDLGLNHVVRKWSEPISRTANSLLAVPGGDDGPSGVLICGESWISYKHQGHVEVRTALPRRRDMPTGRGLLITAATVYKKKDFFFFLLQSELGDLYKVTLDIDPAHPKIVRSVIVSVFDTIQPTSSLCITKTGMLFAASEFGNHALFHFQGLGDQEDVVRSTSITDEDLNEELGDDSVSASRVADVFTPSPKLRNLALADEIESLSPVTDLIVDDISGEGTPQIHALCGRGNRSSLRVLRHGVSVTEMAVSELPGRPSAVWTVKEKFGADFDKYIVVSFINATLVLSIGENVEEVPDSGFLASVPTIEVVVLADDALLQVHATGIRHIRPDKRVSEWKTPGRKQIEKASANSRQVAVSLAGGEIVYFELDAAGQLMEMKTLDLQQEVSCLDIGEIPEGLARASFLVVGCWDDTVQLLSLEPGDLLVPRSTMKLPARADSVCLVKMDKRSAASDAAAGGAAVSTASDSIAATYLNIGLANGVLVRVAVDSTAGTMSDSRKRYLGPRSIKLFRVLVRGSRGVLALSARPWLLYNYQDRYFQAPMSYDTLEYAANFSSELCPEGVVAIAGNTLRIITVDNLGAMFNQTVYPLRYTPRKMCRIPDTNLLVIVESDHNEYSEAERAALSAAAAAEDPSAAAAMEAMATGEEDEEAEVTIPVRGPLPAVEGKWASCLRVMEPATGNILECLELGDNEAAFSVCLCKFSHREGESFVVVGTAKDLTLHPRRTSACYIHVYRVLEGRLQLLHKTDVEEVPLAMCEFNGRLLVGVGRSLRLYELGKKRLLRKCENKMFPTMIVKLQTNADRIYVGDMTESIHFVKYKKMENALVIFADDTMPR
jgi:splicing factor 3B subunit 3